MSPTKSRTPSCSNFLIPIINYVFQPIAYSMDWWIFEQRFADEFARAISGWAAWSRDPASPVSTRSPCTRIAYRAHRLRGDGHLMRSLIWIEIAPSTRFFRVGMTLKLIPRRRPSREMRGSGATNQPPPL